MLVVEQRHQPQLVTGAQFGRRHHRCVHHVLSRGGGSWRRVQTQRRPARASNRGPPSDIADTAVLTQSGLMIAGAGPMPDIYVHQGKATCEIKTSSTITDYKIHDTSNGLSDGVTVVAAQAWSTKAAGLCQDVFTAIKA